MRVSHEWARGIARTMGIAGVAAAGVFGVGAGAALAAGEPVSTAPPRISGTPVVGQPLHVSHAAWTGPPTSYDDWWERCLPSGYACKIIDGAYGLDYTPTAADVGSTLAFGEIAYNSAGQSKPVYSANTEVVFATPPRHFTLVGPTGTPQFAYYLVEPAGRRPGARSWRSALHTLTAGSLDADISPGQTIYFNRTANIGARFGSARTQSPDGPSGRPFRVTGSTPSSVRVVLPSAGRAYRPGLSRGELFVLGQLNRKRRRLGEPAVKISTVLDKVASVTARDEAVHHRFPDPFLFGIAPSFGWPDDFSQTSMANIDAPLTSPAQVLAHWDGKYSGESAGLWHMISWPFYSYVGIADGGGAWNLVLVAGCPAASDAVRACGLTNITGM